MALPKDLKQRIDQAKVERSRRQTQINEYLDYADPSRPRIGDENKSQTDSAWKIQTLYDATLMEVHEDFGSDLVDRVMPRSRDWLAYEPETTLPEEIAKVLEPDFKARTDKIFAAIRQSNLYDEAAGEWAMDLAHGTGAMTISDPGPSMPIRFEAISPGQLLIARGPGGGTSLRAREFSWALEDAMAYWPNYDWAEKHRRQVRSQGSKRALVKITEAAIAVPDLGDERWKWQVAVGEDLVFEDDLVGRGSCPHVVTRWRTHSNSAWGVGPGLKCLPDAMTLNQERRLILKNLGKIVDPPVVFDDDGVLNPEGGIGPGDWLPRMPGSKVEQMKPEGIIEAAYYEQGGLQDSIRRALYQYGPRQRGKTPPTFGQWMDEKTEEGRRLELPTGKVYAEGVVAILERVEYILTKKGILDPAITKDKTVVRLRPLSPLARQQAAEDVSQTNQILTMLRAFADPQLLAATVDVVGTFENIVKALGDKNIVIRSAEDANALLQTVIGGQAQAQPGAPA